MSAARVSVPAHRFDRACRYWRHIVTDSAIGSDAKDSVRVLTWNVWFSPFHQERRYEELLRIVEDSAPEIACFQEVTRAFVEQLVEKEWIREHYFVSDVSGETVLPYGVLMISRLPVSRFNLYYFPQSDMGRALMWAEFSMADVESGSSAEKLVVATSHLESLNHNAETRVTQMKAAFSLLSVFENVLFVGDFNFGQDWEENQSIPKSYMDVWPTIHKCDPGHTMPATKHYAAWRPDRVLLRSSDQRIVAEKITRVGDDPMNYSGTHLDQDDVQTPSDHYGLLTNLRIHPIKR